MKVLVTGISGRIGANLAEAFLDAGHEVRGLVWPRDARPDKLQGLGAELIEGDLRNAEDVVRAVAGVDVRLAGHVPTFYEFDLSKSERSFGYRPQYGSFSMIDSAVAFREGREPGVIPAYVSRSSVV
jgi:NAD(P)-dependent dehydrogenase (short-subunit alcohol dehydrogenase family)